MKKTLTLILSLIMILSMVTGCQKVAQASSSAAPPPQELPPQKAKRKLRASRRPLKFRSPPAT